MIALVHCIEAGQGKHRVFLEVHFTDGRGLCIFLHGGERSHVGGVALAVPRKKSNHDSLTTDTSLICAPGHKDVILAADIAKMIAVASNQIVTVTAGVHVDNAGADSLLLLAANAQLAARTLITEQGWDTD